MDTHNLEFQATHYSSLRPHIILMGVVSLSHLQTLIVTLELFHVRRRGAAVVARRVASLVAVVPRPVLASKARISLGNGR